MLSVTLFEQWSRVRNGGNFASEFYPVSMTTVIDCLI